MYTKTRKYNLLFTLVLFTISINLFSQSPSVKTFINKQDILIGEQINYKVVATVPTGLYSANWFVVPDSMPHFELVDKNKIDTTIENGNTILQQTLTFTSFDSGRWATPTFTIQLTPANDKKIQTLTTDSFTINVAYTAADTTNQLRDIKPIMDVEVKNYLWYYIGAAALLALLAAFFLWRYFKKRKKQPALQLNGKLSAYDEAMQELEKLKTLNLQQHDDIKQFHTKLAAIFKWYISRKQQLSVMNKTTGDVLVHLTHNKVSKETVAAAATALRMGDAVKFAKYIPAAEETNDCFAKIKETIHYIHSSNPLNPLNP